MSGVESSQIAEGRLTVKSCPSGDGKPHIRAVTLDFDGTMFNTEVVFQESGTELLRRRGLDPHPALWRRMMGRRAADAFTAMIELHGLSDAIPDLERETEEIFFSILDRHLRPMPGLITLLDRVAEQRLPLAIATSSTRRYVDDLLTRFEIADRFEFILTADDVTHGKPHPEIYRRAALCHGVEPREMLVIEDTETGTRAAAAAGSHVISIPHEHSSSHDFSGAKEIAERLDDPTIMSLLRSSR